MAVLSEVEHFDDESWFYILNRNYHDDPIATERALGTIASVFEDSAGRLSVDKTD